MKNDYRKLKKRQKKIMDCLHANEQMTREELIECTNETEQQIRANCMVLKKELLIESDGIYYMLTERGESCYE